MKKSDCQKAAQDHVRIGPVEHEKIKYVIIKIDFVNLEGVHAVRIFQTLQQAQIYRNFLDMRDQELGVNLDDRDYIISQTKEFIYEDQ